ncbi:transporter substrate-binding domain-containing protein [Plantactinospora sp. KBS50]|uniref:transporter substrate-binding domain-containing protein n=1 Tax=Plantactinospora sp. KBS50 TaxID=2024580 RepID=UPI0012FD45A2|nr:transporter substrate-binding domain-containing protein [Plantactinospora sp. KBS50]
MTLSARTRVAVLAATVAALLITGTAIWSLAAPDDDTINAYLHRSGLAGRHELRVGIFQDQPLLSYAEPKDRNSTRLKDHAGFEIELIRELASYLGFTEDSVKVIDTQVQNRGKDLNDNTVDVVVASFSITPDRERDEVDFAGPYLKTEPEVLMRTGSWAEDSITIRNLADLHGRLCTIGSSTSDDALRTKDINDFDGRATSDDCVKGLLDRKYDAFMLDSVVLAGYIEQHPKQLKLVDLVLNQQEKYGIAVANHDEYLRQVIGNFLQDSYERGDAGAWQHAWDRTLGRVLGDSSQPRPEGVRVLRDYQDGFQAQPAPYQPAQRPPATGPPRAPAVRVRDARRARRR